MESIVFEGFLCPRDSFERSSQMCPNAQKNNPNYFIQLQSPVNLPPQSLSLPLSATPPSPINHNPLDALSGVRASNSYPDFLICIKNLSSNPKTLIPTLSKGQIPSCSLWDSHYLLPVSVSHTGHTYISRTEISFNQGFFSFSFVLFSIFFFFMRSSCYILNLDL